MTDLRAITEAATPGPWKADMFTVESAASTNWEPWQGRILAVPDAYIVTAGDDGGFRREEDAAYVAAWPPDRALAALDVIEAAQRLAKVLDLASSVYTPERRAARLAFYLAIARWEALR